MSGDGYCHQILVRREGSYRYVMSGSLLGVELKDIRSVPVGYMAEKEMFPLILRNLQRLVGIVLGG